jgi:hypothetical protein
MTIGGLVLIAAHVAVLGLVPRDHLSIALIAGVIALVALKYWWRFRR